MKCPKCGKEMVQKFSTTELIGGTMMAFLKRTVEYAVSPDARSFMIHGTVSHANIEAAGDELSLLEEKFDGPDTEITGIADVIEIECGRAILIDRKTSGSFKIAKALGFVIKKEGTGECFKSGKRKGEEKTRNVLVRDDSAIDRWEWEMQCSKYAIEAERRGFKIDELRIEANVRDGNTYIARSRGVMRNLYFFKITRHSDSFVLSYFKRKREALELAMKQGYWDTPCDKKENWDGLRCQNYCEVAEFCSYGKYLHETKEYSDMPIKGLSEVRRMPRLGKIRLGIKKISQKTGKEYPAEIDYFRLDPQTPSELENKRILDYWHKLFGEQPKSIRVMLPVANNDIVFPQFYKRYGSSTSLKCIGDGETADCAKDEYTTGLKVIGKSETGTPRVQCNGPACPYYQKKECSEVGVLNVLVPEIPGAGVWQIVTGSKTAIKSLNSSIDWIRQAAGRSHMIPLTLERIPTEIPDPKTGKKVTHYILQLNMGFQLSELQRFALIDPTQIALKELPAPELDKEDLLLQEHTYIEPERNPAKIAGPKVKPNLTDSKNLGGSNRSSMPAQTNPMPISVGQTCQTTETSPDTKPANTLLESVCHVFSSYADTTPLSKDKAIRTAALRSYASRILKRNVLQVGSLGQEDLMILVKAMSNPNSINHAISLFLDSISQAQDNNAAPAQSNEPPNFGDHDLPDGVI